MLTSESNVIFVQNQVDEAHDRGVARSAWGLRIGIYLGTLVFAPAASTGLLFNDTPESSSSSSADFNNTSASSSDSSAASDANFELSNRGKLIAAIHLVSLAGGILGYTSGVLNYPSEQTVSNLQSTLRATGRTIRNAPYNAAQAVVNGAMYLYESLPARQNRNTASSTQDENTPIIGSINSDAAEYGSIPNARGQNPEVTKIASARTHKNDHTDIEQGVAPITQPRLIYEGHGTLQTEAFYKPYLESNTTPAGDSRFNKKAAKAGMTQTENFSAPDTVHQLGGTFALDSHDSQASLWPQKPSGKRNKK